MFQPLINYFWNNKDIFMKDHSKILSMYIAIYKEIKKYFGCSFKIIESDNALKCMKNAFMIFIRFLESFIKHLMVTHQNKIVLQSTRIVINSN